MKKNEIPVLLLTGYLGSGKTTLLNRILQNNEGIRFAVIVNDIGEVNIDADLIEKGGIVNQQDDSLVALQNGCICCTLKMDLVQQLYDITSLRRFDYIVIEASGICEPAPIAQTICSMADMTPEVIKNGLPRLDCIVSIVDALRLQDDFAGGAALLNERLEEEDIENLVIQQIEFCNIILLNKASDVPTDKLVRIKEVIRALQPRAEIIPCDYGDVNLHKLLHTGMFDFNEVATSAAWIQEIEGHHDDDDDGDDHDDDDHDHHEDEHHHHHHHHHHEGGEVEEYGIGTFVYYRRTPLSLSMFDDFVARRWPKNIIRAKGICYFVDEQDVCYVFEQAGRQFSIRNAGQWYATMPKREFREFIKNNPGVQRDWDDRYGDRMQKLVFIGQNLDRQYLTEELDKCLAE